MLGDGIRRNIATVTKEERDRFRDAIVKLHSGDLLTVGDGLLRYSDTGVKRSFWEKQAWIHWAGHELAHGGPAFYCWHRELCNRFEALLRQVDPQLSLHYWDWTTDPRDQVDLDGNHFSLFDSNFMGDDGHLALNRVATDGGGDTGAPLTNFPTIVRGQVYQELSSPPIGPFADLPGHTFLWRAVGPDGVDPTKAGPLTNAEPKPVPPTADPNTGGPLIVSLVDASNNKGVALDSVLLTAADGGTCLSTAAQTQINSDADRFGCFRKNALAGSHNYIHQYMSGTEGTEHVASGDPFFFLIHSNLDRIVAMWQRAVVGGVPQSWRLDPNKMYGNDNANVDLSFPPWDGTPGPFLKAPLHPWDFTPPTLGDLTDPRHDVVVPHVIWPIAAAPTGATQTLTTVTIVTMVPHNLHTGDSVTVADVGVNGYNGNRVVTGVPSPTSFTFTAPAGLIASGGGTASIFWTIASNGATQTGTIVTIVTTRAHLFQAGDPVIVAGVGVSGYNGTWVVISAPTLTSFTFESPTSGLAASGNGTVKSGRNTALDPAILIPNSYDTAVHAAYIIVNRDTFSNSEVAAISGAMTFPYGSATFFNAFLVVYDGFTPKELGAIPPAVPSNIPKFAFTGAAKASAVIAALNPVSYEDPSGAVDMPQRIMLSFDLNFTDGSDFPPNSGDEKVVNMQASLGYNVDTGTGGTVVPLTEITNAELLLVNQPNPYMFDTEPGDPSPYWLSVDTRVFQRRTSDPALAGVTQGDMDTDHNAPFTFIQGVVTAFNSFNPANPADPSHPFLTQLSEDETASQLELPQKVGGQRVYNYAVAKVRYLAPAGVPATNVGVFFRVFSTAVSALGYDATSVAGSGNYRRTGNINASSVPLLGIENDSQGQPETACIPFFASKRVRASSNDFNDGTPPTSMTQQPPDSTNIQTINSCAGGGGTPPCPLNTENVAYFGAWLDINLAPGDPNYHEFPLNPSEVSSGWPDGNYVPTGSLHSLQQLMLNTHHCMVAEIFFWPPGLSTNGPDPIPHNASPASSDRLAQRNLVLIPSGNPGYPATHTVQTTFIVKPTVIPVDQPTNVGIAQPARMAAAIAKPGRRGKQPVEDQSAAVVITRYLGPDELMIRWNNVPRKSQATFYFPEIEVDEILALSALRQHPTVLEKVDTHTLRCRLSDVTFIPLPSRKGTLAGLMSLTLPPNVRTGQVYRFSVEQYTPALSQRIKGSFPRIKGSFPRKTLGAFQMTIPVRSDAEILPSEIRKLSVLRYIQQSIPASSRWYSIFVRYIDQIAARVRGFGGDPSKVPPDPAGGEGEVPVCPPHKVHEICPADLFCLNIPWKECDIEGEIDLKLRFRRKCE